jgi:biopolymer transport protein ExbD
MYKRPKKKQLTQDAIPTTSLADMMFLLLIFFIMTTTLSRVTGFVTDMPASGKADQQQDQKTTTIALHENRISVNDENVTMDGLRNYLKNLHLEQKTGEAKVVIVQATGNVTYQNYYETMAAIQTYGGVVAIVSEETR